jgi:hypothetical protein
MVISQKKLGLVAVVIILGLSLASCKRRPVRGPVLRGADRCHHSFSTLVSFQRNGVTRR